MQIRRGDIVVEVTMQNPTYGMDRFGFGYSKLRPGFWLEHGSTHVWQELEAH